MVEWLAMLQIKLVEKVVEGYHFIHTSVPHKREAVTLGMHNDSNLWWEILSLTGYMEILDICCGANIAPDGHERQQGVCIILLGSTLGGFLIDM